MPIYKESKNEKTEVVKRRGESREGKALLIERFNKIERVIGYIKEKGLKFR